MTNPAYANFQSIALEKIGDWGIDVTVKRVPVTGSDPVAGTVTKGAEQTFTAKALVLPSSNGRVTGFDDKIERGADIAGNRAFIIMAAKDCDFQPTSMDKLVLIGAGDSDEWVVNGSTQIAPGGVPIVYRMGISK